MTREILGFGLLVALSSAAGCSADNGALPVNASARADAARSDVAVKLYVSDPVANSVHVYEIETSGPKEIGSIKNGIDAPAGLAVDGSGNLYVANTAGNSVTEYPEGEYQPATTFSEDLTGPIDVAVDAGGTVYVANFYSFPHSIVEFPRGSSEPSVTIRNPCSCYPTGLALDAGGNLYVNYENLYWYMYYYEYHHGTTKGADLGLESGLKFWEDGGVVASSSGALLVANVTLPGVQVFGKGGKCDGFSCAPTRTFATQGSPRFLSFEASGSDIFVANTAKNSVDEYRYPAGTLVRTITSGLKSVYGVAVSPPAALERWHTSRTMKVIK